jgi:solute carrier family 25 phosphate transporter 3
MNARAATSPRHRCGRSGRHSQRIGRSGRHSQRLHCLLVLSLTSPLSAAVVKAGYASPDRQHHSSSAASTDHACGQQRRRRRQQQDECSYIARVGLAGAISTSLTHTAVVPLDVIKTRLQTDASLSGPRAAVASLLQGPNCVKRFLNGVGATSVGYALQGAAKFGGYELCKRVAARELHARGERGEEFARRFQLPIMLTSAACAEVVASTLLCPLESIKLRMQTDAALAKLGLRRALLEVAKADGAAALYKGFVPIALRQVPYTACKLVSFELCAAYLTHAVTAHRKAAHRQRGGGAGAPHQASDSEPCVPRAPIVLASGLTAGAAAAVISQPFDLLLTRMCGSAAVTTLSECVVTGGLCEQCAYLISLGGGAFKGLAPRLVMISIMTSCQVQ